mmetsp:Transcript_8833/g.16642  ORF Transcript_8833/g.16642 Transcript_8833/m.16642 type:complete len:81 (-) Transcript_8833:177-419(-)
MQPARHRVECSASSDRPAIDACPGSQKTTSLQLVVHLPCGITLQLEVHLQCGSTTIFNSLHDYNCSLTILSGILRRMAKH